MCVGDVVGLWGRRGLSRAESRKRKTQLCKRGGTCRGAATFHVMRVTRQTAARGNAQRMHLSMQILYKLMGWALSIRSTLLKYTGAAVSRVTVRATGIYCGGGGNARARSDVWNLARSWL